VGKGWEGNSDVGEEVGDKRERLNITDRDLLYMPSNRSQVWMGCRYTSARLCLVNDVDFRVLGG
jgi:hypothetical protein